MKPQENQPINKRKREYQPPKIDTKAIYEVNALGCAKCRGAAHLAISIACIRGVKKFS